MRALHRRGKGVSPFKCGPDYIDTQYHTLACGRESVNLDLYFSGGEHVRRLYSHYSADADVAVVEGAMGMLDGYSKHKGSAADVAQTLGLPVVLLVNAASASYSVAATIWGFTHFMPEARVVGVIFNRVASASHFSFLRDACADAGVECLGWLPRRATLQVPSRHLGLSLTALDEISGFIDAAADAVEECVDVDRLLELTREGERESMASPFLALERSERQRIAVAHDEAFNFLYRANLDSLRMQGHQVLEFSPLHDQEMPLADILYLPGGYPELFAEELSANKGMRESVKIFIEGGGKAWAECGGMIYLGDEIDGVPLVGALPLRTTMDGARLHLGYREVSLPGIMMRGHEFHYSTTQEREALEMVGTQSDRNGKRVATHIYRLNNLLASYTHLYWGDGDFSALWR